MLVVQQQLKKAMAHLSQSDPVLAKVIGTIGMPTIRPHKLYYQELVQSILGQQLSLQAAAAIEARFIALYEGQFPTPAHIVASDPDLLRSVGLSRAKVAYVQDLAARVLDRRLNLENLDSLSNSEIISELTTVKGIGEWTVHMFLIFCLFRLDVLPTGDLGIKNGIRKLYSLGEQPTATDITAIAQANNWHPYESIASWYVWQSLALPETV